MPERAGTRRHRAPHADTRVEECPESGNQATYLVRLLGMRQPVPVSGSRQERIAAIAEAQRGRAARRQLLAAGISSSAIGRRVGRGELRPVHLGVYAVGHAAPVPLAAETEALLACGEHAALSHHSAALLHGLIREVDGLIREGEGRIHVTVRGRHGGRPEGVIVHRTANLSSREVDIVEGLPVTSPARTLIDVAPGLDALSFERAVEEALTQKLVTDRELRAAAENSCGKKGAARLLALLGSWRGPGITRSEAERRFRALIRAAQLPEPRTNVRLHGYSVDAYWPDLGVVVEVQGYKFHSGRAAFERDTRKGAALTAAGLTVVYVTWRQMDEEPYAVVARVAQVLALAARPVAPRPKPPGCAAPR